MVWGYVGSSHIKYKFSQLSNLGNNFSFVTMKNATEKYIRMNCNALTKATLANQIEPTSTFTLKGALCVVTDVGTRTAGALVDI